MLLSVTETASHLCVPRVWRVACVAHQVVIHLDWEAMTLRPEFDGRCVASFPYSLSLLSLHAESVPDTLHDWLHG